ncbi:SCO2322 family protein, partial [Streptacidiphilus monticola]
RAADFGAVCGATAAVHGKKRVAVVIDYGTAADSGTGAAPPTAKAACAVLDENASSAQALAQLAPPLRYDANGILCAISGYPQTGCGEVVSGGTSAARTATHGADGGASLGWAAGAVLVAALGAGAWYQRRRREHLRQHGNRHGD